MKRKHSDQIRDAIEAKIAAGAYPPGCRLAEEELLEEFQVSRTPLREALIELRVLGLVEIQGRRGTVVRKASPQRLVEMFEVMGELEAMCGRLAARRASQDELDAMMAANVRCATSAAASDSEGYFNANQAFHCSLYAASHNSFLGEQAQRLHLNLSSYRRMQFRIRDRTSDSLNEHDAIIEAITAGEGDLAASLLRNHIIIQGERFHDLIATLPSSDMQRRRRGHDIESSS